MTQINTFQDLLDLLDSHPQYLQDLRSRILSAELLSLPEKLAELAAQVAALTETVNEFVAATNRRLDTLEADVKTIKDDVASLRGRDTERQVIGSILNIARDELGLTRGRVLLRNSGDMDEQLRAAIDQAEEQGTITENDVENLLVADIIIRARRSVDRRYVYAVVEVSRTINNRDIDRARDRAATVAAATGDEALAVVVGGFIPPQQYQHAAERDVAAIIPAMFRE